MRAVRSKQEVEDIVRCYNDPWFFIERMKVRHTRRGIVPFKLYEYQKDVIHKILTNQYTITLKPRQMGITTMMAGLALWMCTFRSNSNVVIISLKLSTAKAFLRKVKGFYFSLPEHLRANLQDSYNDYNKHFGRQDYVPFANGSELQAFGSSSDAGRSESISWLIIDEVAIQKNAEEIWGSAQQTLADGGIATLVSTPYGVGNFYHKTWVGAQQGLNGFYPIELDWTMHPERDYNWYVKTTKLLGERRTAQEVDCSFLNSGKNVFDVALLREIEDRLREQEVVKHKAGDGYVLQYHAPELGEEYVIGADVATGLKAGDYSTFSVMSLKGREMACYKGKLTTEAFAKLLIKWGLIYNEAWLAPEINGVGEGVMSVLQLLGYQKIYHHVDKILKDGQWDREQSLIAGWVTSGKTRNQIITGLDEDMSDDLIEINNPYFISEAWTFIYDANNRPIAKGKHSTKAVDLSADDETNSYTDDAIFSVCIANEVRKSIKANRPTVVSPKATATVKQELPDDVFPFMSMS